MLSLSNDLVHSLNLHHLEGNAENKLDVLDRPIERAGERYELLIYEKALKQLTGWP